MLTVTDIPPGGEGKIEVTFDASHKKGDQKKSITVESNDPRSPRSILGISAFVEVLFGFDESNLDLGRFLRGQSISKTAVLIVKDQSLIKSITFTSTSPYITAKLTKSPEVSDPDPSRLIVEISSKPDIPIGPLNASITAHAAGDSALEASLPVAGKALGSIDITPDYIQFLVDTTGANPKPGKQTISIVTTADDGKVHLLGVKESNQWLTCKADTVQAGKKYEITLMPKPTTLRARQNVSGTITIKTDDAKQPSTNISYYIYFTGR